MTPLQIGIAISVIGIAALGCGASTTAPPGQRGAGAGGAPEATDSGASGGGPGGGNPGGSSGGTSSGDDASTSTRIDDGGATESGAAAGRDGSSLSPDSSSVPDGASPPSTPQELILYDDSNGRLMYVNNAKPGANWISNSGMGRDLQIVGTGRVMLGKFDGWDEYRLSDGVKVAGQHGFAGTEDAYRLTDGNTMLASVSGGSIVLKMVNPSGQVQSQITYKGFSYVRLVRPTSTGSYLVTADTVVFEGDDQGTILWRVSPAGANHAWKAMRLANGNTAISTGYGASVVIYDHAGHLVQTIGGPGQLSAAQIAPWFYADFHVMPNGTYFIVNSQADRTMNNSVQLLEYDASNGALVWQQKQPSGVRSLEEGIVLDGLDTNKLYVEPAGELVSFP
jgi:hypothetical protein